jgi:hypothetical protein
MDCVMRAQIFESMFRLAAVFAALIATVLLASGSLLAQSAAAASQICAARDVKSVILIEDHGEANDIAASRLAEAGLMQMEARIACKEGRSEEGIAIYDKIIHSLGEMLQARP